MFTACRKAVLSVTLAVCCLLAVAGWCSQAQAQSLPVVVSVSSGPMSPPQAQVNVTTLTPFSAVIEQPAGLQNATLAWSVGEITYSPDSTPATVMMEGYSVYVIEPAAATMTLQATFALPGRWAVPCTVSAWGDVQIYYDSIINVTGETTCTQEFDLVAVESLVVSASSGPVSPAHVYVNKKTVTPFRAVITQPVALTEPSFEWSLGQVNYSSQSTPTTVVTEGFSIFLEDPNSATMMLQASFAKPGHWDVQCEVSVWGTVGETTLAGATSCTQEFIPTEQACQITKVTLVTKPTELPARLRANPPEFKIKLADLGPYNDPDKIGNFQNSQLVVWEGRDLKDCVIKRYLLQTISAFGKSQNKPLNSEGYIEDLLIDDIGTATDNPGAGSYWPRDVNDRTNVVVILDSPGFPKTPAEAYPVAYKTNFYEVARSKIDGKIKGEIWYSVVIEANGPGHEGVVKSQTTLLTSKIPK